MGRKDTSFVIVCTFAQPNNPHTLENLHWFILLALISEVLGTIGGFGSSMFFVPLAGMFLDFYSVLGITALFHVASNISKIALFKHGIDKQLMLRFGIPAVFFVIIGALTGKYFPIDILEISLSFMLVGVSISLLLFPQLSLRPTSFNIISGATVSGFMAGLVGTGGAIRGITLAAFQLGTAVFIATSAAIDLGIDLSRSVVYSFNGYVHRHDLYLVAILFVVSFIGSWIGKKILEHVSEKRFRSMVLILVMLTGIFTLTKLLVS